jgi:serine/threonine protein kinase
MYHIGKDEGAHYITMEYVRGEDLKSMIRWLWEIFITTADWTMKKRFLFFESL